MLDAVLHDARNAWRGLRRRPGFAAVAVLTFGLGIGLHAAVFSVLIRALPYTDPEQLVVIRTCDPDGQCSMFLPGALAEALPGLSTIDSLAATGPTLPFTVSPELDSDRLQLLGASPNLLRVLGVMPVAGRDFIAKECRKVAEEERSSTVQQAGCATLGNFHKIRDASDLPSRLPLRQRFRP